MKTNFDNFVKFLILLQGTIGIFFMYKCISYPEINVWLCFVAGITIVSIILSSTLLLTNCFNSFYYEIADLDQSIKNLNSTIQRKYNELHLCESPEKD